MRIYLSSLYLTIVSLSWIQSLLLPNLMLETDWNIRIVNNIRFNFKITLSWPIWLDWLQIFIKSLIILIYLLLLLLELLWLSYFSSKIKFSCDLVFVWDFFHISTLCWWWLGSCSLFLHVLSLYLIWNIVILAYCIEVIILLSVFRAIYKYTLLNFQTCLLFLKNFYELSRTRFLLALIGETLLF